MRCGIAPGASIRRVGAGLILAGLTIAPIGRAQGSASPRERVEQMTPEQREQVFRKQQRFEALAPSARDHLRQLHEQLAKQPDRQELQGVMERYHEWLAALSPLERRRLEGMTPRERLAAVEEMRKRQLQEQRPYRLPTADREKVTKFLRRRIDSDKWYDPHWIEQWDQRRRLPEPIARQFPSRDERDDRPDGPQPRGDGRRSPRRPDPEFFKDMDALFEELTPETQAQLNGLSPRQKIDAMRGWLRQGMRAMAPSEKDLEAFFANDLNDERREQLLELAPDEMLHELRGLYMQKHRPQRGGDFHGGDFRGPPRGDDRPRRRRGEGPEEGPPPDRRPHPEGPPPGDVPAPEPPDGPA